MTPKAQKKKGESERRERIQIRAGGRRGAKKTAEAAKRNKSKKEKKDEVVSFGPYTYKVNLQREWFRVIFSFLILFSPSLKNFDGRRIKNKNPKLFLVVDLTPMLPKPTVGCNNNNSKVPPK